MSVATTSFFNTYAQLIQSESDAAAGSFYGTEDYNKLESLGPTLPKLPYQLPSFSADESNAEDVVTVNVKSIKPPFKFSTQLTGVSLGQSVYKIKSTLVEEVDVLKNAGAGPGDLKFMIKAKVVSDLTVLSSLAVGDGDISFTVLVSAPAKAASEEPAVETPSATPTPSTVRAATWQKIFDLLAVDIGAEKAKATVEKFKSIA